MTTVQQTLESPVFHRTRNSDEWVIATLHIQEKYWRVLLVDPSGSGPRTVRVGRLELNSGTPGDSGRDYPVTSVFRTLQQAVDEAQGGDLVAVMPGEYDGFVLGDKASAGDHRYIHLKAMGEPGEVVIGRPADEYPESGKIKRTPKGLILLQAAHHVILEGFNIDGGNEPECEPHGPYSGIKMEGNFANTGKLAHHIVITNCFSHHNRTWGMLTTETHTVLLQNSLFGLSREQHSCYVSDGSDNYVIRNNVFYGSPRSGLQCNMDAPCSLSKVASHPAIKDYVKANPGTVKWAYALDGTEENELPTRDWALGLLKLATETFGENNFPDGKGLNFIIEGNVINRNGRDGAGSMNLSGIHDSLIQNNLIYSNFSHGIALWHGPNPYDIPYIVPGPQSPEQVQGPLDLPLFGCQRNLIRNNTVLMDRPGRAALQCRNGSWGNKLRNNVFINDASPSIQVYDTSVYRYDAGFNVVNTIEYVAAIDGDSDDTRPMHDSLKSLATALDAGERMVTGVLRHQIAPEFMRYGEEPWVVLDGNWWKLNPNRPDFHPKPGSPLLAGTGDAKESPPRDLCGASRVHAEIGAFRAAG